MLLRVVLKTVLTLLLALGLYAGAAGGVIGDIIFERESEMEGFPVAYFPHWVHRIQYRCYVCHDAIFTMKKGANEVTMEAMSEGKACGVCHNGTIAWAIDGESCNRCHVGE